MNLFSAINFLGLPEVPLYEREPHPADGARWVEKSISGRLYRFAQPLTFTPYAAVKPCSARCLFCSENLREISAQQHASTIRPGHDYFEFLAQSLQQLCGVPLSFSLSGLEMTDDIVWFTRLLECLSQHAKMSPVEARVLYTNAVGLAKNRSNHAFLARLKKFNFSWFEVSRHHHNTVTNQRLMRFRDPDIFHDNTVFAGVLETMQKIAPVKLVCVVQREGVEDLAQLLNYLSWARSLGVKQVIIRELASVDERYKQNATYKYIEKSRVSVVNLMQQFLADQSLLRQVQWCKKTKGYYFRNLIFWYNDMEITFEAANYSTMHSQHNTGRVYKLVQHGNGNLCADWDPFRHVIYTAVVKSEQR